MTKMLGKYTKMKLSILNNKRGTLMLMVLMGIIIGGIVALRLLPSEDIKERRIKENSLSVNLTHIREAFDLKRMEDPSYNPSLDTRGDIKNALIYLRDNKYLGNDSLKDPTIPAYLWDTNDKYFWKQTENLASNTSFEGDDAMENWKVSFETVLAEDIDVYMRSGELDDYPDQNKYGDIMRVTGSSLIIVK